MSFLVQTLVLVILCVSPQSCINSSPLYYTFNQRILNQQLSPPPRQGRNGGIAQVILSHCGTPNDPVVIRFFRIDPNPIRIPGLVRFNLVVETFANQTGPMQIKVEMSKKIPLFLGMEAWIQLPCYTNGLGSCNIDDVCQSRYLQGRQSCPSSLSQRQIPCHCPFQKGVYSFPEFQYELPPPPSYIHPYFLQGDFKIKFLLTRGLEHLACYETDLKLDL